MKSKQFNTSIKQLGLLELVQQLHTVKADLLAARLSIITSQSKDSSRIKKARKNVARILTKINNNKLQSTDAVSKEQV
jgi:ribosomal protein L29